MKPWEKDETILARWLSGELSEEEHASLEATEGFDEFLEVATALDAFDTPTYAVESELANLKGRISQEQPAPQGKQVSFSKWIYFAAASVVLLLSVGLWFWLNAANEVEVVASKDQHYDLPDGSFVELRSQSRIRFDKNSWEEARTISLQGEAFFDVEKGSTFQVQLANGTVTVLGTSFNIYEEEQALTVTCYTGKVRVEAFGEQKTLDPGDNYRFQQGSVPFQLITSQEKPGWLRPVMTLEDVSLEEALRELQVNYHFQVEGVIEEQENFNCVFPTDDLETALKQVLGPYGIDFHLSEDQKTVTLE